MMNKKGISLMEIIVSIALLSIVTILLFNTIANIRRQENLSSRRSENLINQALLINKIQTDLLNYTISAFPVISHNQIEFHFNENIIRRLTWSESSITYDNQVTTFNGLIQPIPEPIQLTSNNQHFFIITIPIIDGNQTFYIEIAHYWHLSIPAEDDPEHIDPYY